MNDIIESYLKGREEGYFNVRLGYDVLYMDPQARAFFGKGFKIGEKLRKQEENNETEAKHIMYNQMRNAYITIVGYKSTYEYYIADESLLKNEDDIKAFEEGCRIGLEYKSGTINELNSDDADLYAIISGYNNAIENDLDCTFIVKEENMASYQRGYNVGKVCKDIKTDAMNELNEIQINSFKNKSKKK